MCKKMKVIGIGAAGNKAILNIIAKGVVDVEDTMMINSTSKDIPATYPGEKVILSDRDTGSGKQRNISKTYLGEALRKGTLDIGKSIAPYQTVVLIASVEGGTGSGSTPQMASMIKQVYNKTPHIIAITGFEEDVRGLYNTVEFFQEVSSDCVVETISNKAFLAEAYGNKFKAEQLANDEIAQRLRILLAKDFIDGEQNIDSTDILKLINAKGYMTVEKHFLGDGKVNKHLVDTDAFNKVIKNMIYDSKSLKSNNSSATRIGVVLNLDPLSMNAVDFNFTLIKEEYGDHPYEFFIQKQWDGKAEYIAYIASGMKMPIDEIKDIYNRYKAASEAMNRNEDSFFNEIQGFKKNSDDSIYDLTQSPTDEEKQKANMAEFLKNNF